MDFRSNLRRAVNSDLVERKHWIVESERRRGENRDRNMGLGFRYCFKEKGFAKKARRKQLDAYSGTEFAEWPTWKSQWVEPLAMKDLLSYLTPVCVAMSLIACRPKVGIGATSQQNSTPGPTEGAKSPSQPPVTQPTPVALVTGELRAKGRSVKLSDELLSAALRDDWHAVAEAVNVLAAGERRNSLVKQLLQVAPKEVLTKLLAFFEKSSLPEDQRRARDSLFERGHELPFESLVELALAVPKRTQPHDDLHPIAVAVAARRLLEAQGLAPALDKARQQLVGDRKSLQNEMVASLFQSARPEEIMREFGSNADALASATVYEIGRHIGRSGSIEVADWIRHQTQPSLGPALVRGFVASWLNREAADASQWVSTLPPGITRDTAAKEVADYSLDNGDNEAARKWVETIADEELRTAARARIEPSGR